MNNIKRIKKCKDDKELKELVDKAIKKFTNIARKENSYKNYIGTYLDINPLDYHIDDPNFRIQKLYECVNLWYGYVPLGTKIVYGRSFVERYGTSVHNGCYYYLDDDSYIFDFFKKIKEEDVEDDFDIILLAFDFIEDLLEKFFDYKDRDELNKLIYKTEDLYFRPIKEHSIKDFYGNGSALCSEKSLIAENLLSILGLEVMYVGDKEHTYNIYVQHVNENGEEGINLFVLDFGNWVSCYDVKFNLIGRAPYIQDIENGSEELVNQIVNEGKRIELDDYYLLLINGIPHEIRMNKKRSYGTDFGLEEEKKLILERK